MVILIVSFAIFMADTILDESTTEGRKFRKIL